jgi:tight adherence protein C
MQLAYIIGSAIILILGLILAVLSLIWIGRSDMNPRLRRFVAEQDLQAPQWSGLLNDRTRELSGSLNTRLVNPFIRRIGLFFGRLTPTNTIEDLKHRLYIAGNPMGLGPREFYGMRFIFMLVSIWPFLIIVRSGPSVLNLLLALLIIILCYLFPLMWLRLMVRSRQDLIRKGLADTLDMLSVCADAGLGFDQSLQRVSEQWKPPISTELGRVVTEMEMGLSRREALRNLADRLDISEVSSFVAVILQSDQLGMSIADTLHVQAEQMRVERRYRAQEQARMIPIKMLIPLAFLIFPAIIAVILGPAIPPLIDLFKGL